MHTNFEKFTNRKGKKAKPQNELAKMQRRQNRRQKFSTKYEA